METSDFELRGERGECSTTCPLLLSSCQMYVWLEIKGEDLNGHFEIKEIWKSKWKVNVSGGTDRTRDCLLQ